jgi:hypothetical protein
METLKSLLLHENGKNFELSVQLSGGVASVTLGHDMSDSQVIQQLHCLAHLIEEGARERAGARCQLNLTGV